MKTATGILSDEHQLILKGIGALVKEATALQNGKAIDKKFFESAIDFIRNYADKFHHMKEEDILFKELCGSDIHMHCNPVDQMLHEHDIGRGYVKGMEEGIRENDKRKVAQNAISYATLLSEHIFKEDNILYPMADEALSPNKKKSMLERFREAEAKLGEGYKKKYEQMAIEFEARK